MHSIHAQPPFDNPPAFDNPPPEPTALALLQERQVHAQAVLAAIKGQQEKARGAGDMAQLAILTARHGQVCQSLQMIESDIADAEFETLMVGLGVAA